MNSELRLQDAQKSLTQKDPRLALDFANEVLGASPACAEAIRVQAEAHASLGNLTAAVDCAAKLIESEPANARWHVLMAHCLWQAGHSKFALLSLDQALALDASCVAAHVEMADVLMDRGEHVSAQHHYREALDLDAAAPYAIGGLLHASRSICDWDAIDAHSRKAAESVLAGERAVKPFSALLLFDDLVIHRAAATTWREHYHPSVSPLPSGTEKRDGKGRIRVGYFSGDFRPHPLMYSLANVFEHHDRSRFEIIAFSSGPPSGDPLSTAVRASFDQFHDVSRWCDRDVAALARKIGLDIAVDLSGYTSFYRADVFQIRAAPVQIEFAGYPGTTQLRNMDFLIADPFVIPAESRDLFSERVIDLPHAALARDERVRRPTSRMTRADCGLPQDAFVYCSFNSVNKLTREVFDCWMTMLLEIKGSVLWLADCSAAAQKNLAKHARRRGVEPCRIVYAARIPDHAQHLQRIALADLSLDTLPYNAHITAADALLAGVPHLTCVGNSFAARVAGSVLTSLGLVDLVTDKLSDYTKRAIMFGKRPDVLRAAAERLRTLSAEGSLFDSRRFAAELEATYEHLLAQAQLQPALPGPGHSCSTA